MWVGRGFDTNGDGDNDIFFAQQITPEQQRANAAIVGFLLLVALAVAGCIGLCLAIDSVIAWLSAWWQVNATAVISWAGYIAFGSVATLVVALALGVLFVGVAEQAASVPTLAPPGPRSPQGPSKPCPRCGADVVESHLTCPSCRLQCPYSSDDSAAKAASSHSQLFSPAFCVFACGVLAAADGRLTNEEARAVARHLRGVGFSEEQLRDRLLEACRKIHFVGEEKTLGRLGDLRRDGQCFSNEKGLSADTLIAALHKLGEECGGELARKHAIRDRLVGVVRGSL